MRIEFIIPTYNRPNNLKVIISSLLAQTNPNWSAHIISDGDNDEVNNENIKFIRLLNDDRIKFTRIEGPNNDWGHTARNYGLDELKEEWVVMTGDDNYYAPVFVEKFIKLAKDDVNFVYCNMVHNNYNYFPIKCSLELGKIDIGNFMSRSKFAKTIKLNPKDYNADWEWIRLYIEKFRRGKILAIEQVLYVHN